MDILIAGCIIALLICGIGVCIAFIMGIKDDLKWGLRENERLEHDVDWWQDYCDKIVEEHKETLNEHEERLSKLQSKIKDLEREIDAKNDEILYLEKQILNYSGITVESAKPLPKEFREVSTDILEANELREATKDLDFPPVGKIEEDPTDFWPTNIIKSDAINKFLNRQSKKEDENNG